MRREFPTKVRVAVIKRSTRDGQVYCEKCGGPATRFQIDHVRPDGLGGEPVIENAMLICEPCWREKNPQDTTTIAKAKRREARHLGATKPTGTLKSANNLRTKERTERPPANGMTEIQRRYLNVQ